MKQEQLTVLTGDRPTGPLHLGHYTGALSSRLKLQGQYRVFVLIADLQALTDHADHPDTVAKAIWDVLLDNLAVGLNPDKVTFVLQSGIPELAELAQVFLDLVSLARLQRNPTVKDEMKQKGFAGNVPAGFLCYPVSQAADIAGFDANLVPVGEDQVPVVEQTREIVRRFNSLYGDVLVLPEAMLSPVGSRLPGIDGRTKMSASLGNAINLSDPAETVTEKVMRMYTDPTRKHASDPGHTKGNPVFSYLDAFDPDPQRVAEMKTQYRGGQLGDVPVKQHLAEVLNTFLEPIRVHRTELSKDKNTLKQVLIEGTAKGRKMVATTVERVLGAIGFPLAANM